MATTHVRECDLRLGATKRRAEHCRRKHRHADLSTVGMENASKTMTALRGMMLLNAITDVGIDIPKHTYDMTIEIPTDGVIDIVYRVRLTDDDLSKIANAFQMLSREHIDDDERLDPRLANAIRPLVEKLSDTMNPEHALEMVMDAVKEIRKL